MLILTLLAAVTAIGMSVVMAQNGVINQEGIPFVGGDQLACYDASGQPTENLDDVLAGGEFRLLNIDGQILMTIPGSTVQEAIDNASPNTGVQVATGSGSQGPAEFWIIVDDTSVVTYRFIGTTEPGKTNSFDFRNCSPIKPPVAEEDEDEEDDPICHVVVDLPRRLIAQDDILIPETISCDDCGDLGGEVIVFTEGGPGSEDTLDDPSDVNDGETTYYCVIDGGDYGSQSGRSG